MFFQSPFLTFHIIIKANKAIYIGKSINIQQRVKQHFSGKDRKSQKLQHFTDYVSYKLMGSELISLLYESHLIKKHHPIYNRSQRRKIYQYGLFLSNTNGYQALTIGKITAVSKVITTFSTLNEAKEMLFRITEKYQLCQKINGLYKTKSSCFQPTCYTISFGSEYSFYLMF